LSIALFVDSRTTQAGHRADSRRTNLSWQQGGKPMSRNFGVPQHITRQGRGSVWPMLLVATIMVGAINVAALLHHW
jgi:hypothetical protein